SSGRRGAASLEGVVMRILAGRQVGGVGGRSGMLLLPGFGFAGGRGRIVGVLTGAPADAFVPAVQRVEAIGGLLQMGLGPGDRGLEVVEFGTVDGLVSRFGRGRMVEGAAHRTRFAVGQLGSERRGDPGEEPFAGVEGALTMIVE